MKTHETLFKIAFFAIIGFSFCKDISGDLGSIDGSNNASTGSTTTNCTKQPRPIDSDTMYRELLTSGLSCLDNGSTRETSNAFRNARTKDDFRKYVNSFCSNKLLIKECLLGKATYFEGCRNESYVKLFKIYSEVFEAMLDAECARNGERVGDLLHGIKFCESNGTSADKQIKSCLSRSITLALDLETSLIDISSKVLIFFREMQLFKECAYQNFEYEPLKKIVDLFLGEIINTMKCIDPEDDTIVPCASIDVTLISSLSVCSVKTNNNNISIFDAMENEAGLCFDHIMSFDSYYSHEMIDDYKQLQLRYEVECSVREFNLITCLNMPLRYFYGCMQDEKDQHTFELLKNFITNASRTSCSDNGRRLADIMFQVYRLKKTSTEQDHAVWECIREAKSTRHNIINESSSKNMRFYHELETFKGCFLNKLQGDQTSVDAATSLINEILKMVECSHPEEGTTVFCETLIPKK